MTARVADPADPSDSAPGLPTRLAYFPVSFFAPS
jgi:hypothetical protein